MARPHLRDLFILMCSITGNTHTRFNPLSVDKIGARQGSGWVGDCIGALPPTVVRALVEKRLCLAHSSHHNSIFVNAGMSESDDDIQQEIGGSASALVKPAFKKPEVVFCIIFLLFISVCLSHCGSDDATRS